MEIISPEEAAASNQAVLQWLRTGEDHGLAIRGEDGQPVFLVASVHRAALILRLSLEAAGHA